MTVHTDHKEPAVTAFLSAMRAAGIIPLEMIADRLAAGEFVRFRADGDKPGRKNGWAKLFVGCSAAGAFGHHRLGISTNWRYDVAWSPSTLQRREIAEWHRQKDHEQRIAHDRAAAQAVRKWATAAPPDKSHPYLLKKNLYPFSIRQAKRHLLVPMWDHQLRLRNIQTINTRGQKRFLAGAKTDGLFWHYGIILPTQNVANGPVVIAEGYATAAAIHIATGHAVIAAMSAKNLIEVAKIMRDRFPSRLIIMAADYDGHLTRNLGVDLAQQAAEAVGAAVAYPLFLDCCSPDLPSISTDFADCPRRRIVELIERAKKSVAPSHD